MKFRLSMKSYKLIWTYVFLTTFILCFSSYTTWTIYNPFNNHLNLPHTPTFLSNPDIRNYTNCFPVPNDIESFVLTTKIWKQKRDQFCFQKFDIFDQIFEIRDKYSRKIKIPKPFYNRLLHDLGHKILSSIHNQHIIHVTNRLTFELSIYNPLRSKRPQPTGTGLNVYQYIEDLVNKTATGCDFCHYVTNTAVDELGRHEKKYTVRMTNTFKMDRWHGLVISRGQHDPHQISMREFVAMFEDGNEWANDIHNIEPDYAYPALSYDTFYRSAASQIHPHVHVLLSSNHQYGTMYQLQKLGEDFFVKNGENLFTTLTEIHSALGLAIHLGDAVAFSTLVGRTDLELMFLSEKSSGDIYRLLYIAVKTFEYKYDHLCYSIFNSLPKLSLENDTTATPTIIRLYSRGDCQSPRNDVSSHELTSINYRDHDPWELIKNVREVAKLYPPADI